MIPKVCLIEANVWSKFTRSDKRFEFFTMQLTCLHACPTTSSQVKCFDTIYPMTDLAMLQQSSKFSSVGTSWLPSYRVLHMTLDYRWPVQSVNDNSHNSAWGPTVKIWITLYPPRCRLCRKLGLKMALQCTVKVKNESESLNYNVTTNTAMNRCIKVHHHTHHLEAHHCQGHLRGHWGQTTSNWQLSSTWHSDYSFVIYK